MPRPARSTGTIDHSAATRRPWRRPSGVSTVHVLGRQVAHRLGRRAATLMRARQLAERFGRVRLSRSRPARPARGVVDEVDGHGARLYDDCGTA